MVNLADSRAVARAPSCGLRVRAARILQERLGDRHTDQTDRQTAGDNEQTADEGGQAVAGKKNCLSVIRRLANEEGECVSEIEITISFSSAPATTPIRGV